MRKLMLSLVFVLGAITMVNANSNVILDDGCASDCVSTAREGALAFASDHSDRGAGGELMTYYNMFYQSCYDANCAQ